MGGVLCPQPLELHSQHAAAAGSGHWCRARPADADTPAPYFQDYWLVACADAMGLDFHVEANGKRVSKVQINDVGLADLTPVIRKCQLMAQRCSSSPGIDRPLPRHNSLRTAQIKRPLTALNRRSTVSVLR